MAGLPWDQEPNRPPCISWATCARVYAVHEVDDTDVPWETLREVRVCTMSADGVLWEDPFPSTTLG